MHLSIYPNIFIHIINTSPRKCINSYFIKYFRVNDDTVLKTSNWSESYINTLKTAFSPSYLGLTGPVTRRGIYTYDFTHRTHMDIFGIHYPHVFPDWFGDGWITKTYKAAEMALITKKVTLKHVLRRQRYPLHKRKQKGAMVMPLSTRGATILQDWKSYLLDVNVQRYINGKSNETNVISFALNTNNLDFVNGAFRNLMLAKRLLPNWQVRVYAGTVVEKRHTDILTAFGAQVVSVSSEINIPHALWPYMVADDPTVSRFIVRNVTHRLSPHQCRLLIGWHESGHDYHTIRDLEGHTDYVLVPDLFGAMSSQLHVSLGNSVYETIRIALASKNYSEDIDFLNDVLLPKIDNFMSHDSVSHSKWSINIEFDKMKLDVMKIGQPHNQYEEEVHNMV